MKNFLVIKEQDRGGSFFIKNRILKKFCKGRRNYIYDPNYEYAEFKNHADEIYELEEFLDFVPCETNSFCNVVFEESTSLFSKSGRSPKKLKKHTIRRFHTKNINVFVFHSLDEVPLEFLINIDFIVLFRTGDDIENMEKKFKRKFPKIFYAWLEIQKVTEGTKFNRKLKTYPDEYSKNHFHDCKIISRPFTTLS